MESGAQAWMLSIHGSLTCPRRFASNPRQKQAPSSDFQCSKKSQCHQISPRCHSGHRCGKWGKKTWISLFVHVWTSAVGSSEPPLIGHLAGLSWGVTNVVSCPLRPGPTQWTLSLLFPLTMRTLSLREVRPPAQGHTAGKWWNYVWKNTGLLGWVCGFHRGTHSSSHGDPRDVNGWQCRLLRTWWWTSLVLSWEQFCPQGSVWRHFGLIGWG